MNLIKCKTCGKKFRDKNYPPKPRRFCSRKCFGMSQLGKIEDKSKSWVGDKVGYHGVHSWLTRKFGKPKTCQISNKHKHTRYEWANLNGGMKFKRDKSHYIRLCKPCHIRFDYGLIGIKIDNKIFNREYRWKNYSGVRWDKTRRKWVVGFQNKDAGRFNSRLEAIKVRKELMNNFKQEIFQICT